MEKMTKKVAFGIAIDALKDCTTTDNEARFNEAIEILNKAIAQLDKKAEDKKPSKTQIENESIKGDILNYLASVERATIKDIILNADGCSTLSSQKTTALVSALVKNGRVIRTVEKKVAYFSIA